MNSEQKKMVREVVEKLLADDTCTCDMFAGMKDVSKDTDSVASYEPDGSKTVVLRIKGGANNVEITPVKIDNNEEDPWGRDSNGRR